MSSQGRVTLRLAPAARRKIEEWAERNCSSLQAEINRSILDRAERERQQEKVSG